MHDNWLIAIALSVSALGIIGLLFALIALEPPLSTIDDARAAADGETLRIEGTVVSVQTRGNVSALTISQPTTLSVTLFGEDGTTVERNVKAGDCVVVQGKRSSFDGVAQLTASKVQRCG